MPTYIMLLNWTEQGISKIKDSSKRLDAGRKAFKKAGCELKDVYLTMGQYDLVCTVEAPDGETAAKAILSLGLAGNVRTLTLPAFTEDEYRRIIGSL
jgi:uncharacterized protein with GYD domain